jgi:UDP-N-acetylglucosamine 2-epimerase (non-hydrolysing)
MTDIKPTIHLIAAARPNFPKIAPIYHQLIIENWCVPIIIHTGQHYDANMSDDLFKDLNLPDPHIHLQIGSGSHAEQTAGVMVAYEKLCMDARPDYIVVVGDVNSTMACTLVAKKLWIPVAHLEAGLRSNDWHMPEEINRIVTDTLCDLLWTPSEDGNEHLQKMGISEERIEMVGNVMMDSYEMMRAKIDESNALDEFDLEKGKFAMVTLHRPSNVDQKSSLAIIVEALIKTSKLIPLVFPMHPRTQNRLKEFGFWHNLASVENIRLIEPLSYVPFMKLVNSSALVITDSGGIQEETTYLNIPCLTVRENTERPITITQGTNQLITPSKMAEKTAEILAGKWQNGVRPAMWDGKTAERVTKSLRRVLGV